MTLSDLIAVMRDGKIVQFGPTKEIYRRPRDLYVATFVGKPKMSLVDGSPRVGRWAGRRSSSPDVRIDAGRRPIRSARSPGPSSGSRWGSAPRTCGSPRTARRPTRPLVPGDGPAARADRFRHVRGARRRRRDRRRTRRARRRPDARPDRDRGVHRRPDPPIRTRAWGANRRMSDSLVARLSPTDFEQVARARPARPDVRLDRLGVGRRAVDARQRGSLPAVAAQRKGHGRRSERSPWRPRCRVSRSTSRSWLRRWASRRCRIPTGSSATAAGVAATGRLFVEAVNATTSMEDIAAAFPKMPFWLQLYNWATARPSQKIIEARSGRGCLRHRAARQHHGRRQPHPGACRLSRSPGVASSSRISTRASRTRPTSPRNTSSGSRS